jgi:cyanophycinase
MPPIRALLSLALAATLACAPQPSATPAPDADRPRGTLFIVGGGPTPDAVTRRFVALAGGPAARIVVFPMASAVESTGPEKVEQLEGLGARATSARLSRDEALRPESARLLDSATGVWFSGGDQSRLTAALAGTPVERAIHDLYGRGGVIGGTSAGAAVMSARMLTGDERRPGGDRPDSTQAWITVDRDNVVTAPGFGLLPGVVVDQHFLRRRRHNRLLSLVLEGPDRLGVGIDEGTAVEVRPDGTWQVLGASAALVLDARGADATSAGRLGGADVRLHLLPAGATFDPGAGRATLP